MPRLESIVTAAGRQTAASVGRLPGLLSLRKWIYQRRFQSGRYHCGYNGVYETFDAAAESLPSGMAGFDHEDMTDIGHYTNSENDIEPMPATEYPALFWLRQALDEGARTLLDFGGYVGHAFHQYDQYLKFPDDFSWTVYDLPEITKAAENMARRNPRRQLKFTNRIDDGRDLDILLAAGSLQYVREGFLLDLLEARRQRPRHIIVQRTPLHAHRTFATIQAITTRTGSVSFCPYTVAKREEFISSIVGLGYQLIDSWEKQREIDIPFEPEFNVGTYSGFYFRLNGT